MAALPLARSQIPPATQAKCVLKRLRARVLTVPSVDRHRGNTFDVTATGQWSSPSGDRAVLSFE